MANYTDSQGQAISPGQYLADLRRAIQGPATLPDSRVVVALSPAEVAAVVAVLDLRIADDYRVEAAAELRAMTFSGIINVPEFGGPFGMADIYDLVNALEDPDYDRSTESQAVLDRIYPVIYADDYRKETL